MEKLNRKQIEDLLPHRDPMLLVDELYDINKLTSATWIVNVKKDSFFLYGNFADQAVRHFVLIVDVFLYDVWCSFVFVSWKNVLFCVFCGFVLVIWGVAGICFNVFSVRCSWILYEFFVFWGLSF